MKLAIVILNWNGEKMLRRFLPSVVKQCPHDAIVIVADNGSTDHSLEVLRQDFPSVYVEELKENFGFAEGYNRALSREEIGQITAYDYLDYFVLLNSDVEVSADWLQPLTRFMDEHPDAAACQPKLRAEGQRDYFEYAGAAGATSTAMATPTAEAAYSPRWNATRVSTTPPPPCYGPQGPRC